MKVPQTLLCIPLTLVLIFVLLGFVGPKSYDVSRTIEINAPAAVVFPYMKSIKKQNEWGPWLKQDPEMKVSYEGEDGTVGFVSKWDGEKVGRGEQRISSIMGTTVESELTIHMPLGESKSTGYMHAADAAGGSEVTWGMRGENNFIGRIFGVFMNMDKGVGPMFDEGLLSLKQMVEGDMNKPYKGHNITIVDIPARQYVVARGNIAMTEISAFMGQHFPRIAGELAKANISIDGAPSGLYFTWDEASGMTDMAAGFPVKTPVAIPNTEVVTVAAGKALSIDYIGPYGGLEGAHMAIDEYSKSAGTKTKPPAIEEYITDPMTEPDSTKWLTKIYYLLDQ